METWGKLLLIFSQRYEKEQEALKKWHLENTVAAHDSKTRISTEVEHLETEQKFWVGLDSHDSLAELPLGDISDVVIFWSFILKWAKSTERAGMNLATSGREGWFDI